LYCFVQGDPLGMGLPGWCFAVASSASENPVQSNQTTLTYHITLEADLPSGSPIDPNTLIDARTIIQKRFVAIGIRNAKVLNSGPRQISIDFPVSQGKDPEQVVATISQNAILEFVDLGNARFLEGTTLKTDYRSAEAGINGIVTQIPDSIDSTSPAATSDPAVTIFHTVLTGASLSNFKTLVGTKVGTSGYVIKFSLKPDARQAFADYTGSHIGQVLAILLDKKIIWEPTINAKIDKGEGYIEANFTKDTADALANLLRIGPLPIPLKVIASEVVPPK
jgi:preprotein translocase subunit SecD